MGKRGRKAKEVEILEVKRIYPPENETFAEGLQKAFDGKHNEENGVNFFVKVGEVKAEEFENILSVMPWEKIDLKKCTREEISTVLIPRFYADKDKMPTLINALQNALSLEEKVTMQTFTMSRREKMELKKKDTVLALSKEIKPILSTKADDFVDLFKEFGFTADGKEKKSFSLSETFGHRVGKEHYKLSFSVQLTKDDVPLTDKEILELQYQKSLADQEAEWEKMRLNMVGHEHKEMAKEKEFARQFDMTAEDKVNSAKTAFSK